MSMYGLIDLDALQSFMLLDENYVLKEMCPRGNNKVIIYFLIS